MEEVFVDMGIVMFFFISGYVEYFYVYLFVKERFFLYVYRNYFLVKCFFVWMKELEYEKFIMFSEEFMLYDWLI